jgi:hypothetical protein
MCVEPFNLQKQQCCTVLLLHCAVKKMNKLSPLQMCDADRQVKENYDHFPSTERSTIMIAHYYHYTA